MRDISYYIKSFSSKFPESDIIIKECVDSRNILVKTKYGLCKVRWSHLFNGVQPSIKTSINKTEFFKNQFFEKFPDSNLEIIKYKDYLHIIVKTDYGLCETTLNNLFNGYYPSISSAVNKTEYFINQAKEIHGDRYDYSLVEWFSSNKKVKIICPVHGMFEQRANSHLCVVGCPSCAIQSRVLKISYNTTKFMEKANKIHNNKYDYSLSTYVNSYTKIKITCKKHGVFEQNPSEHLKGAGCKKCGHISSSDYQKDSPTGWSLTKWENKAKKSKHFDSFKVYILECWNENERFYKIGRTFNKVQYRYNNKKSLPYDWKIIKIVEGISEYVFKLEHVIKKLNNRYKYIPQIRFAGMQECFKKLKNYEL